MYGSNRRPPTSLGLTLREAREKYSDPDLWAKYEELLKQGKGIPDFFRSYDGPIAGLNDSDLWPILKVERPIEAGFRAMLEAGELVATGRDTRSPLASRRVTIPRELWPSLSLNFNDSSAHSEDYGFHGVRIRLAAELRKKFTMKDVAALRAWLADRVKGKKTARAVLIAEAEKKFPNLSGRIIKQTIGESVPKTWTLPGRPRSGRAADRPVGNRGPAAKRRSK